MTFQPSADKIKDILKRRLLSVTASLKRGAPSIFSERSLQWLVFGDENFFGIIFIDDTQRKRITDFEERRLQPFPGLFTTDTKVRVAFRLENARNNMFSGCTVENMNSFSIDSNSTIIIVDHTQILRKTEIGDIEYRVPLAYVVSFGSEITFENAYDYFEDLVAYSVSKWRQSDVA